MLLEAWLIVLEWGEGFKYFLRVPHCLTLSSDLGKVEGMRKEPAERKMGVPINTFNHSGGNARGKKASFSGHNHSLFIQYTKFIFNFSH